MNFQSERICRLCLKTVYQSNFEEISEITKELLDVLQLKLNLTLTDRPVICNECEKDLQESFEFKSICIYTEDIMYPLYNFNVKLDLKDIYSKQNNVKSSDISENQNVCRLCLKLLEMGFYMPLNEKLDNTFNVVAVLHKYIPEMKLNATASPVICLSCLDSLQHLNSFLMATVNVEDKITKYTETEGTSKKGKLELNKVQKCFSNIEKDSEVVISKMEDYSRSNEDITHTEINNRNSMKLEDISCEIKKETDEDITMTKQSISKESNGGDLEISIIKEEIDIKSELSDSDSAKDIEPTSKKPERSKKSSTTWKTKFKCKTCEYETFNKGHLKRHSLIHKDPSEIKMYKCEKCTFETKHEGYIAKHMWSHHTDPSKITIYKCEHCTFKSKRVEAYRKHLPYHVNPSTVKVYQCEICQYKTLYKNTYAYHSLTHKDASEVQTMFKCDKCTYESKHKQCLTRHKFIHKDPSEIPKFECNICDYKSKSKKGLSNHMITHKDPSEVRMFQCSVCAYQSKYRYGVKLHERTHKDPSELTMFKCTFCTYETKYRGSFKNHVNSHKK